MDGWMDVRSKICKSFHKNLNYTASTTTSTWPVSHHLSTATNLMRPEKPNVWAGYHVPILTFFFYFFHFFSPSRSRSPLVRQQLLCNQVSAHGMLNWVRFWRNTLLSRIVAFPLVGNYLSGIVYEAQFPWFRNRVWYSVDIMNPLFSNTHTHTHALHPSQIHDIKRNNFKALQETHDGHWKAYYIRLQNYMWAL